MRYRALIPVKKLEHVKTRLAPHLSLEQRATLMLDMLQHVINTLHACEAFERISVVSPDQRILDQVRLWGAWPRREEASGHNPALQHAAYHDLREGTNGLLTISADLPLLHSHDILGLLERACGYDLVLVPSREGAGTNALLTRPPLVVPYLFGLDSLRRHRQEAEMRHLRHTLYSSIGLSLDVDTIDDLEASHDLAEMCQSGHAVYL